MSHQIRVTNRFTGKATTYDGIEAMREGEKATSDAGLAALIDMLADAYAGGNPTDTYEWLLGRDVAAVEEAE